MSVLRPGETFPDLAVDLVDGGRLELPAAFHDRWGVVLFNRGAWCPYCQTQLRAFQRNLPALTRAGASVVSLSVDDRDTAKEVVDKYGLTFPVGRSADARARRGDRCVRQRRSALGPGDRLRPARPRLPHRHRRGRAAA